MKKHKIQVKLENGERFNFEIEAFDGSSKEDILDSVFKKEYFIIGNTLYKNQAIKIEYIEEEI